MKIDTQIEKIVSSDASYDLKILKLQNLAFKQFAASPNQKKVTDTISALKNKTSSCNI